MHQRVFWCAVVVAGCGDTASSLDCEIDAGWTSSLPAVFWEDDTTRIQSVAHRGFKSRFPENTQIAIEEAFNIGADLVEVDVRFTRDRIPVLMHDASIDRTTDGVGLLSDIVAKDLAGIDACSWFDESYGPCPIPTLDDALKAARGRGRIILDLKEEFDSCDLKRIVEAIQQQGLTNQVALASLVPVLTRRVRRYLPAVPLALFISTPTFPAFPVQSLSADLLFVSAQTLETTPGYVLDALPHRGLRIGAWDFNGTPNLVFLKHHRVGWALFDKPWESSH